MNDTIKLHKIKRSDLKTINVKIVMDLLEPYADIMKGDDASMALVKKAIQWALQGRSINDALMMVDFATRPYLEPLPDPNLEDTDENV